MAGGAEAAAAAGRRGGVKAGDVGNAEGSLWPHLRQNAMKALHKAVV